MTSSADVAPVASRFSWTSDRRLHALLGLAVAVLLGWLVGQDLTAAFAVALVAVATVLVAARPATWIALAIGAAWFARVPAELGLTPRFTEFLDFPLVLAALLSALRQRRSASLAADQRRLLNMVAAVALVMTASWVVHDPGQPQRLVAALLLTLEPFLLIAAMLLGDLRIQEQRRLLKLLLAVAVVQLPMALLEFLTVFRQTRDQDTIRGTLLNADAGAHLMSSGLLVGFLVMLCLGRRGLATTFGALSLLAMLASDAKQILLVIPVALVVFALAQMRPGPERARTLTATLLLSALSIVAILSYRGTSAAFSFIERTGQGGGKSAVAAALWHDVRADPTSLLLGLGPGNSVSRLAFLSTPGQLRTGSPVQALGITPAAGPPRYLGVANAGPYVGNSSFSSPQSSAFGVLGDTGLLGVAAFLGLVGVLVQALRRRAEAPLRAAALAMCAAAVPLAFAFDWLEEPPFTLLLALISGLVLVDRSGLRRTFIASPATQRTPTRM